MGEVANLFADYVYITDDNPRGENPKSIREDIIKACPKGKDLAGRAKAISYSIKHLNNNDILLIAGKGHEDYQIINDCKNYFSDYDEVERNT